MSIISKYVFRQSAGALLLILSSLGGIIWIALALKRLNVVTSQGQDALLLLKMTTLALPNLLAIIAPFALLIATMHTLNRLSGDSELIVLTASGATVWSVGKPLILLAMLVSIGVSFTNHVGMPWSLRELRNYIVKVRTDLLTQVIQPGRFSGPEDGLTFHIRERTVNGDLLGLVMHDVRKPESPQSYLAEKGVIQKQGQDAFLIMFNGHIMQSQKAGTAPNIIEFEKYIIDLAEFDKRQGTPYGYKPRETSTVELIWPNDDNVIYKNSPGQYRAELHERFSNPLYPLVFVLIALATAGQAQSTRQNRQERLIVGFIAAIGLRMATLGINNLVAVNAVYVPLLYLIPIAAGASALYAIRIGARPRGSLYLSDRLNDFFSPIIARFRTLPSARDLTTSLER